MDYGPAWVIFEVSARDAEAVLLSVLSSRRSEDSVCDLLEQLFVDRYGDIKTRLLHKKRSAKTSPPVRRHLGVLQCGQDPGVVAVCAKHIKMKRGIGSIDVVYLASTDASGNQVTPAAAVSKTIKYRN